MIQTTTWGRNPSNLESSRYPVRTLLEVGSCRIGRNSFEKHNPNETLVLGVIHSPRELKWAYIGHEMGLGA